MKKQLWDTNKKTLFRMGIFYSNQN